jgi:DNA mismatch repair protein MLH3
VQSEGKVVAALADVAASFLRKQGWLATKEELSKATSVPQNDSLKDGRTFAQPPQDLFVHPEANTDPQRIKWTDPQTGEVFVVDPKTGHTRNLHEYHRLKDPSGEGLSHRVDAARLEKDRSAARDAPAWLADLLAGGAGPRDPPVSKHSQPEIPCVHPSEALLSRTQSTRPFFLPTLQCGTHAITKADLARARVIGQVDTKYILCRLPDSDALFLIDQHAADERVRVERFLSLLCASVAAGTVAMVELASLHLVLVTRAEHRLLLEDDGARLRVFEKWGLKIEMLGDDESAPGDYLQVGVSHVPEVVERRLRAEPHLIRDFVGR